MLKTVFWYLLAAIGYWVGTLINPLIVAIFVSIVATIQFSYAVVLYYRVKREQERVAAELLYKHFRNKFRS